MNNKWKITTRYLVFSKVMNTVVHCESSP